MSPAGVRKRFETPASSIIGAVPVGASRVGAVVERDIVAISLDGDAREPFTRRLHCGACEKEFLCGLFVLCAHMRAASGARYTFDTNAPRAALDPDRPAPAGADHADGRRRARRLDLPGAQHPRQAD